MNMRLNSIKLSTMPWRGVARLPLLGVLCFAMGFISCEPIFDKAPDCRLGVSLRFVYDYHMEPGANAFHSNVDCVNVLIFDSNYNFIGQQSESRDVLRDENYRMELLLDEGDYHLVVYGGLDCDKSAFTFSPDWLTRSAAPQTRDDIRVTLPLTDGVSEAQLHDIEKHTGGLFYGIQDISLTEHDYALELREVTVPMMKDTNNIQVVLQQISAPYQIDIKDYDIRIIDDNFVLDGYNNPVHIATDDFQPVYKPYATYNRVTGYVEAGREGTLAEEDNDRQVQVACAEFSTSRLFFDHLPTAYLVVTTRPADEENGTPTEIIRLPLIEYLAMIRGYGDSWIKDDQEFLDRQSRWSMIFFLQHNTWASARIAVNWWTVRVNEIVLDY